VRPLVVTNEMRGRGLTFDWSERSVRHYLSFAHAVDQAETNPIALVVDRPEDVTADLTVPANVRLQFLTGGRLRIAAGVTVTIESPEHVEADPRQRIFEPLTDLVLDDGAVEFAGGGEVFPGWWGAVCDGVTDDVVPIQRAVNSVEGLGGVCRLEVGTYFISGGVLQLKSKTSLRGRGMYATRLTPEHNGEALSGAWSILAGQGPGTLTRWYDIGISDLSIYCTENIDPADPITQHGVVGFERITGASVRNVYFYNGSAGVQLKNCERFDIENIVAQDVRDYVVAFLSETRYGRLCGLVARNVGEVLDFGPLNSDIVAGNIEAVGNYPGREEEAIDFGAPTRILIHDFKAYGDWRVGVNLKWESERSPEDCTFQRVELRLTNENLSRGFYMVGAAAPEPEFKDIRFIDCHVVCAGTNNDRGAIGGNVKLRIDGLTIQGGYYYSARTTIFGDPPTWMKRVIIDGAQIVGDPTNASSWGIYLSDCFAPIIRNCKIGPVGQNGIILQYNSTDGLDATNKIIGAQIVGNTIENHGQAGLGIAVRVRIVAGFETGETYNALRICGNQIIHDDRNTGVRAGREGIRVEKGDLTAIDYAKVDDNLIYRIPVPTSWAGVFGINSTQDNNTTFAA
ncbi:MAG: glycosyl hydrolase family 28-related protein, partial [Zavarzinia sp.]|nr:glycosyl hydrolase family 28-related protein [Zavarzinia sp.]